MQSALKLTAAWLVTSMLEACIPAPVQEDWGSNASQHDTRAHVLLMHSLRDQSSSFTASITSTGGKAYGKQHSAQTSLPGSVWCSAAPGSSSFPLAEEHGSLSRSTQGLTQRQKLNEMAQFSSSLPIHCVEKFLTFNSRQICALHAALPVENSFLPAHTPVPLRTSAFLLQPLYPFLHHQHPK